MGAVEEDGPILRTLFILIFNFLQFKENHKQLLSNFKKHDRLFQEDENKI